MFQGFRLIATVAAGIAVVIGLLVFVAGREKTLEIIFGPMKLASIDFASLKLTSKPNQFLVCPADYCAAQAHLLSPVFNMGVEDLKQRWLAMLAKQPRIESGAADYDAMQYDYIQRSEIVRFPDSITVRFIPLKDGQATLAVYSRSHYGHGDQGVNEARIRAWLALLK